jgi:uncharacterized protein
VIAVSDSSPLISFAKIERFTLLRQMFGVVTISAEVYAEVAIFGAGLPGAEETSTSPWIQVRQINRPSDLAAAQELLGLGLGELSTLILAKEIAADLVILDDRGARQLAQKGRLPRTG